MKAPLRALAGWDRKSRVDSWRRELDNGGRQRILASRTLAMGQIVAGLASSHAFALLEPESWDRERENNRAGYRSRYGVEPPNHPGIAQETIQDRLRRYARVRNGLDFLRQRLRKIRPDALILVGDDQNEHFSEINLPQIAMYLGREFFACDHHSSERGPRYPCNPDIAEFLLRGLVHREFDLSVCRSFHEDRLIAHAFSPILRRVAPEADLPVVLLFVNALHLPAMEPFRCYSLGQAIRDVVAHLPGGLRLAIYASGGLSHFSSGYPWNFYHGPHSYGSIAEDFDRKALALMAEGAGEKLAELTSEDLLENGAVEMRSWLVLLGALGKTPAQVLAYEPFYSGIMGMGVAYWDADPTNKGAYQPVE